MIDCVERRAVLGILSGSLPRVAARRMAFAWQTTYYPDRIAYQAALCPFAKPAWIHGVTIHHTYRPTVDEWRGARTMDMLSRFYRAKGWSAGPHLFLAPDGIWAGTPLALPGVHAGVCNSTHIGLEIVGDYDQQTWSIGLRARIYDLIVLLLHWIGATEAALRGHRECLPNKSCPGAAIGMDLVRADVRERLFDRRFVVAVPAANVRLYPRTNSLILAKLGHDASVSAHPVIGESVGGDAHWARVKLSDGRVGHVWAGLGRWEPV